MLVLAHTEYIKDPRKDSTDICFSVEKHLLEGVHFP